MPLRRIPGSPGIEVGPAGAVGRERRDDRVERVPAGVVEEDATDPVGELDPGLGFEPFDYGVAALTSSSLYSVAGRSSAASVAAG